MYGVRPTLPCQLQEVIALLSPTENEQIPDAEVAERVSLIASTVAGTRDKAKQNIDRAQTRQKSAYDIKHKGNIYQVYYEFII